ncbi:hypothetical protein SAMN06265348_12014 [Pedobacter westerhofensis]|uniref:Erythromycin esterase n=1 Tax=Pedobacter westerhofensis TaxID=425512 RepID=A0A521FSN8_9SPHI|nr:hypothetical protein [Pedobacter westerhofensis]SMO99136.1 hypothetical protein SAMN06265348_12014 [Pedobacter westerhofensis]
MKKTALLTLLIFFGGKIFCQTVNVYNLGLNYIKQNQYLKAIDTVKALRKLYYDAHRSNPGNLSTYSYDQAINLFSSFVGEDYPYKFEGKDSIVRNHKLNFTPAIPYIIELAKKHKVVMINENHYIPKHRILTYNLLQEFYDVGYRYLALEALIPETNIILKRDKAAVYANEPNMGNLIREAQRLGFHLVSYESEDTTPDNPNFPAHRRNMRELLEARNLYQILVKDPEAKILVHAGVSHIWEQATTSKGMYMAEYFKVISGIDPLTINQSVLDDDEFTSRIGSSAGSDFNGAPVVVLDSLNVPTVSAEARKGDYDITVAWPKVRMKLGRNDYMLQKAGIKISQILVKNSDVGNLIQIFEEDDLDGIPVDQFIVKKGIRNYGVAIAHGRYQIQSVSDTGHVQWRKPLKID